MKFFEIYTEENGKDVGFGVHGVYADNEKDAIRYAEIEIVADFLSMGYKVKVGRIPRRSIIYVWDNDEDTKYRKITIWAIDKEFEEVKEIIKEHFNEAPYGLFFCRNTVGDEMNNIYNKNGIQIDICYKRAYFEVLGLDSIQQLTLEKYYNSLEIQNKMEGK
jgi:hypothetical protein